MYKYNIYFLTKMGDLQNIHTALVSILQISHARDTTQKMPKNCVVGVSKNLTNEIVLEVSETQGQ